MVLSCGMRRKETGTHRCFRLPLEFQNVGARPDAAASGCRSWDSPAVPKQKLSCRSRHAQYSEGDMSPKGTSRPVCVFSQVGVTSSDSSGVLDGSAKTKFMNVTRQAQKSDPSSK